MVKRTADGFSDGFIAKFFPGGLEGEIRLSSQELITLYPTGAVVCRVEYCKDEMRECSLYELMAARQRRPTIDGD
jgi:hypothetical protein